MQKFPSAAFTNFPKNFRKSSQKSGGNIDTNAL
jgi:hypothetical protein